MVLALVDTGAVANDDTPSQLAERQAEGRRLLRKLTESREAELAEAANSAAAKRDRRRARRERLGVAAGQVLVQALGTVLGGWILFLLAVAAGFVQSSNPTNIAMLVSLVVTTAIAILVARRGMAADAAVDRRNEELMYVIKRSRIVEDYRLSQEPGMPNSTTVASGPHVSSPSVAEDDPGHT